MIQSEFRRPAVLRIASLLVVSTLAACSSGGNADVALEDTELATNGSACVTKANPPGELCFKYDAGEVTVQGSGLEAGSRLTVTGGGGDTVEIEIGDDESASTVIGARLVLPPFTAEGTWTGGEAAVLTVDE